MKILDLFCGQGGAAMGYHRAGWQVTGVDLAPQPRYPFEFVQADALTYLAEHGHEYDAVHASPPCQGYSALAAVHGNAHPLLIPETRALLIEAKKPAVIENVAGAPLRKDLRLCGETFGLGVLRHRYFEMVGWSPTQPPHKRHRGRVRGWRHGEYFDGPYVQVHGKGGGKATAAEASTAMGIDWMDYAGLVDAIPPAYTEVIGAQIARVCSAAGVTRTYVFVHPA